MTALEALTLMVQTAQHIVEGTPIEPRQHTTLVLRSDVVKLQEALKVLGVTAKMRRVGK